MMADKPDFIEAVKLLFDNHKEKVEKLRTVVGLGVTQEAFDEYERQSLESCHKASQALLQQDIHDTFGNIKANEDGDLIVFSPSNQDLRTTSAVKKTYRKRKDRQSAPIIDSIYKCTYPDCGKCFVNAGNLKNHSFAHERVDKLRSAYGSFQNQQSATPGSELTDILNISHSSTDSELNVSLLADGVSSSAVKSASKSRTKRLSGDGTAASGDVAAETPKKRAGGSAVRKAYSLEEKLNVLAKYDELVVQNEMKDVQFNVGRIFSISQSLVSKWLKQRGQIEENVKNNGLKRIKVNHNRPSISSVGGPVNTTSAGNVAHAEVSMADSVGEGGVYDGALLHSGEGVVFPKKKGRSRIPSESEPLLSSGDFVSLMSSRGSPSSIEDDDDTNIQFQTV